MLIGEVVGFEGNASRPAIDQPVNDIANREQLRAGLRGRLLGVCPSLRHPRSQWVCDRAVELVVDANEPIQLLNQAIQDFLEMQRRTQIKNPAGYLQAILARHFRDTWTTWHKPQAET